MRTIKHQDGTNNTEASGHTAPVPCPHFVAKSLVLLIVWAGCVAAVVLLIVWAGCVVTVIDVADDAIPKDDLAIACILAIPVYWTNPRLLFRTDISQFTLIVIISSSVVLSSVVASKYPSVDQIFIIPIVPLVYIGAALWAQVACESGEGKLAMWFLAIPVSTPCVF